MLPEDLMLLFLDDVDGRVLMDSASIHNALAGAVLLELVRSGRVAFEPNGKKLISAGNWAGDAVKKAMEAVQAAVMAAVVASTVAATSGGSG